MLINDEQIENLQRIKNNEPAEFKREIEKITNELFNAHCSKKSYKEECDPFCADAFTDTCQYLKEMRKLWDVFGKDL